MRQPPDANTTMTLESQPNSEVIQGNRPRWQFSLAHLMFVTLVAAIYAYWFKDSILLGAFFSVLVADSYLLILRIRAELRVRAETEETPPTFEKRIAWTTMAIASAVRAVAVATFVVGTVCLLAIPPGLLLFQVVRGLQTTDEAIDLRSFLHVWVLLAGLPLGMYFAGRRLWRKWPRPGNCPE